MAKKVPYSKMLWRYKRLILATLLTLPLSPIIYFTMDKARIIIEDLHDTNTLVHEVQENKAEQEMDTRGCRIQDLDPLAEDFGKVAEKLPMVSCEGIDWVNCHKSKCHVPKAILRTVKDIVCLYRDIIYVDDRNFDLGDPTKVIGDEKYSLNQSDHVQINCTGKDTNSPEIRSHWSGLKAGFRPVSTEPVPSEHKSCFNVMILCFESMSRNGLFMRKMRDSYKYLIERLNGVVMKRYNIVADGTTGALFPILTGKLEDEHKRQIIGPSRTKYFDPKKFIFHILKEYGYRTAFFEDKPWTGTGQYQYNWFGSQPVDHYLRTMLLADARPGVNWSRAQGPPTRHCFGAVPQYQMVMDLTDEFLQLVGKKFCFTFINDMAYDNFTIVPTPDEVLLSHLQSLSTRRAFEDTLVVVMGDHGSRYSEIRGSQAKLEERLPFLAIILPEKLKKQRPSALTSLRNNVDVLTTPFDIHATILDVLDLKDKSNPYFIPGSDLPRAMSFLEPIPKFRSCGKAGVMPHWCACIKWSNVSRSSPKYTQVATVLAQYIDGITLRQRSKCAKRRLISTEWVIYHNASDHLSKVNYFNIKDLAHLYKHPNSYALKSFDECYQAKIVMSPGRCVFEGTMIYNRPGDYFMISQRDISRVSPYGDESNCISVTHPHLNKYCYCEDKIGNTNCTNVAK